MCAMRPRMIAIERADNHFPIECTRGSERAPTWCGILALVINSYSLLVERDWAIEVNCGGKQF